MKPTCSGTYWLFVVFVAVRVQTCSHVWTCEALLRARLVPSSYANNYSEIITSGKLPSASIESLAPQYVMLNPNPFNITANLYLPTPMEFDTCSLSKLKHPHIIISSQSQPKPALCLMCSSPICLAEVRLTDVTPVMAALGAHTYWRYGHRGEVHPPAVAIQGGTYAEEWILHHVQDGNVQVTITSGDRNEAAEVLQYLPLKIWTFISCSHSLSNILGVLYKLSCFIGMQWKDIPKAVPWVLIPEFLANILRLMFFFTMVFFEMQLWPNEATTVIATVPLTLGVASTLGISVLVYDTYQNAGASESADAGQFRYKCSRILIRIISITLVLDVIHRVYAGFFAEVFPASLTAGFYTVLQIPVSVVFIRFGNSTARLLLSRRSNLKEEELQKRARFARRVKFSGIAMIVNIISLVLFVACNGVSISVWLYLLSIVHETSNGVASFQIYAVRTPDEKIPAKAAAVRLNQIHPSSRSEW